MISADLGSAISDAVGQSFGLVLLQAALSSNNALTAGTFSRAQAVTAVEATLAPIRMQISQASTTLVSPEENTDGAGSYGSAFAAKVTCAGSLATAVNISSYVGRIRTTLGQAG
jgi:hypothetical protein